MLHISFDGLMLLLRRADDLPWWSPSTGHPTIVCAVSVCACTAFPDMQSHTDPLMSLFALKKLSLLSQH